MDSVEGKEDLFSLAKWVWKGYSSPCCNRINGYEEENLAELRLGRSYDVFHSAFDVANVQN